MLNGISLICGWGICGATTVAWGRRGRWYIQVGFPVWRECGSGTMLITA